MDAASEARNDGHTPQNGQTQRLAAAVRAAAASAANQVGGGLALVFACGEASTEGAPRLRAAAGFTSAQAARDAAQSLIPEVCETLEAQAVGFYAADACLGTRASGGLEPGRLQDEAGAGGCRSGGRSR